MNAAHENGPHALDPMEDGVAHAPQVKPYSPPASHRYARMNALRIDVLHTHTPPARYGGSYTVRDAFFLSSQPETVKKTTVRGSAPVETKGDSCMLNARCTFLLRMC